MNSHENLDEIATQYHSAPPPDIHIENACQEYEVNWLHEALYNRNNILDLGIGDGLMLKELVAFNRGAGSRLTCIEGSSALVEQFSYLNSESTSITHSLFEDYETDERFDAIVASHILEHVEDPVEVLRHLGTFMQRDAVIIGIVPNSESIHRRLAVSMGIQPHLDSLSPRDHLVGHQRVYSLASLSEDLISAGFHLTAHRGFFLKVLSNGQMLDYDNALLGALLKVSDDLPTELCANIGFVATNSGPCV